MFIIPVTIDIKQITKKTSIYLGNIRAPNKLKIKITTHDIASTSFLFYLFQFHN